MKTVCIQQLDDGSYSVYEEMPEAEGMEPEGLEADEGAAGQTVATLDEALAAAAALFDGAGGEEEAMMQGEAEFQAGFNQARGGGMEY